MKFEWKTAAKIGVCALILFLCIHYCDNIVKFLSLIVSAAAPLIAGCVIAYIINILMSFYERHYFPKSTKKSVTRSRRPVCMVLAFLTLVLIIILLLWLVIPELVACIQLLASEVPGVVERMVSTFRRSDISEIIPKDIMDSLMSIDWEQAVSRLIQTVINGIGGTFSFAAGIVSSVFSKTLTVVIGIIFSFYILIGRDRLKGQIIQLIHTYIPRKANDKIKYVASVFNDCFRRYIVGQCTEAVILGTLCAVGMLIFRFPYAVMIGAVIGFTALIPVAGAYIGAAIGFFLILTVSPIKALLFILYIIILQQIEGNLIYPKVVGTSIGLPGIWVLAAITVGGSLCGIPGILLSVPIAAAIYKLVRQDVKNKKEIK